MASMVLNLAITFSLIVITLGDRNHNGTRIGNRTENRNQFLNGKIQLWPNATVYYKINCTHYAPSELNQINGALMQIQSRTCVKFVRLNGTDVVQNYINLTCFPDKECESSVGMTGGVQVLNLAPMSSAVNKDEACTTTRKIQHEFLHALGFKHEIELAYRDQYIQIHKQNIQNGYDSYFLRDPNYDLRNYGCNFSYNTVIMPPSDKHSKNNQPVFTAVNSNIPANSIGIANNINDCDVTRMNKLYCGQ